MSKVLIGVDPSYNRTGIAAYYNNSIVVSEVKGKEVLGVDSFSKSFEGIYIESYKIVEAVQKEIEQVEKQLISHLYTWEYSKDIISECPPPQGNYAPGLYALDTRMFDMYNGMSGNVYRVYPNYLMHIHGKKNYQKSESVELAKKILDNYNTIILSKRLSHDESEAVIFLSRLLYKEGLLPDSIVNIIPNIKNEKEALFVY